MTTLLIIIGSIFVAGGQVLLKTALSVVAVTGKTTPEMFLALLAGLFTPKALTALFLTGVGSFVYFMALRLGEISAVVPATAGLIIAFVALIGWTLMKDPMPALKIAGLILIIGGIALVSRPA